ncbi:MAG: L-arabinose isomerase, partial [Acholeplasmataceae bacterium]|nr:L-arabinose isomerase [Acholeplasmataceae bacterium]
SQHLYGPETLKQVASDSEKIAAYLDKHPDNPCRVTCKKTVTTSEEINSLLKEANNDEACAGIIVWMHTFSPAKMWIEGLANLQKPILHFHTQANEEIPFESIDMDFMNLNQSAHGDREFGYIMTRMRINRKVVAGYYQDEEVLKQIFVWMRAAAAFKFSRNLNVVRIGDNMRDVAVTEGDKVSAQIQFGWSVNGYGLGDLVDYVDHVSEKEVDELVDLYRKEYSWVVDNLESIREQARYEIAIERMLKDKNAKAITTNFENLYGLKQLPGLSIQRLMAKGYGFGAEGDWKTAALTAIVKYMASGLPGGTSFMEDYTYHLKKENQFILGAHMLEICPSIAADQPKLDVQPLGIGGKNPPARLRFKAAPGKAVVASLIDMGDHFRLIVNKINIIEGEEMPKLPVAQVLWKPEPSLQVSATAWIYAGGAHHTVLSTQIDENYLRAFANIANIEYIEINNDTNLAQFTEHLMISDFVWKMKG